MSRKFYEGAASAKDWASRTLSVSVAGIARGLSGRYKFYREANRLQRVDAPVLLTAGIIGVLIFGLSGTAVLAYEKFFASRKQTQEIAALKSQVADVAAQLAEEQAKPKAQPAAPPPRPVPKPSLTRYEIEAKKKVIDEALALANRAIKPAVKAARDSLNFAGPRGAEDTPEDREKSHRGYIDNLNTHWSALRSTLLKAKTFANQQSQWSDIAAVMTISYPNYNKDFNRLFSAANVFLQLGKTQSLDLLAIVIEAAKDNCSAKLQEIERAIDDATKKLVEIREATVE